VATRARSSVSLLFCVLICQKGTLNAHGSSSISSCACGKTNKQTNNHLSVSLVIRHVNADVSPKVERVESVSRGSPKDLLEDYSGRHLVVDQNGLGGSFGFDTLEVRLFCYCKRC
jgi:hypothetical protein